MADDQGRTALREKGDSEIHSASAWILRAGVVASVSVMLFGLALSLWRGSLTVAQMQSRGFGADYRRVVLDAASGDGVALIEIGIFLLVLTPILRVATSALIFATHERDWLYASVTTLVLALTLASLLFLR